MIPKIKKILYATDLSKNSAYAFRYAVNSAKKHGAEIIILHVIEEIGETSRTILQAHLSPEFLEEKSKENLAHVKERINQRLSVFYDKIRVEEPEFEDTKVSTVICVGYPAEEILRQANKLNCDAIVMGMGTHGKGLLNQAFLGSVAKKVLRRTRKPVFIIPLPKEESDLTCHDI
jgi:nucleotide-binding universal stress UspA family protein